MTDMVERVSKAIFDAMDVADGLDGSAAERYALAAIEAMREPTDVMTEAGAVESYGHTREEAIEWAKLDKFEGHLNGAANIYNAMIDAALSHNQNEGESEALEASGKWWGKPFRFR